MNNDRLKYRVHFPDRNGIMQNKQIHYLKGFRLLDDNIVWFETIQGSCASCKENEIVFMQCTGKKDSTKWEALTKAEKDEWLKKHTQEEWSGKLIYDGDFIELEIVDGESCIGSTFKERYLIKYSDRFGIFILDDMKYRVMGQRNQNWTITYITDSFQVIKELKIIGNIHENPELLESEG